MAEARDQTKKGDSQEGKQRGLSSDNDSKEPAESTTYEETEISERHFRENITHYMDTARTHGLSAFQQELQNDLDSWKAINFNIALLGQSGSGKSSLINAILGLTAEDKGGAEVGFTETTKEIRKYSHPQRQNLILWDMPGVDTPNYPIEKYWVDVKKNISDFDFFFIVSAGSFKGSDILFARDIQQQKSKFYFVRTKVDIDVENDKKAYPKTYNRRHVQTMVKRDIIQQLRDGNVEHSSDRIFLVNNYDIHTFDFQSMLDALIKQAPELKRQAFILSLAAGTQNVIDEKVKVLEGRLFRIAFLGALSSAVPIPGTGLAVEIGILYTEAKMYREQFGIDEDNLTKMSQRMRMDVRKFKEKIQMKHQLMFTSAAEFLKTVSWLATSESVENIAKYTVPFVGSIFAGLISFPMCYYTLKNVLSICKTEASNTKGVIDEWLSTETNVGQIDKQ